MRAITFTARTVARLGAFLSVGLALAALWACDAPAGSTSNTTPTGSTPKKLRVVCTVGMISDLARSIAAEHAEVVGLMGEGVDPHLYKPTRTDIASLTSADIIFYNGLLLEGKMTDALMRVATSGKPVHAVTEGLDEAFLIHPDGTDGHEDPHVWMDPRAWIHAAGVVRDRLAELDPARRDVYAANATSCIEALTALDAYAERCLATVPAEQRVLITAHDAFNYFGRRYNYEVVGIQGISTESEAGLQDIARLTDLIVHRRVGAVFVESTVSDRSIRSLIAGAEARGHRVIIGGNLFSDAMGQPGTYEGTYLGMIDHNVTTIARALGGDAPQAGFQGKLTDPGHTDAPVGAD